VLLGETCARGSKKTLALKARVFLFCQY